MLAGAEELARKVSADIHLDDQGEADVLVVLEEDAREQATQARLERWRGLGLKRVTNTKLGIAQLKANRTALDALAKDPEVRFIAPNREISAAGSGWINLQQMRGLTGLSTTTNDRYVGTGVGVAVLDSGIDPNSAFKKGFLCTTNRIVYKQSFLPWDLLADDGFGHGTHVASILANNGTCDGGANGVAPDVNLINLKVLDSNGKGSDAYVIRAIDKAIELKVRYNIRVMNLSLGRPISDDFTRDPLCIAVEKAWKAGIVVVVAAGNNGRDNSRNTRGYGTIAAPGNDPYVITVGAVRDAADPNSRLDDTIATYSAKGPTLRDQVAKPDLVAPGNQMVAYVPLATGLTFDYPSNRVTYNGDLLFFRLSGTSMAAPVVTGAAALLIQQDPSLTPDQVKVRLMKTAWKGFVATASIYDAATKQTFQVQHDLFTVGAGMVDIRAALASAEKAPASTRALSPRVVTSSKGVSLSSNYSDLGVTNVVWGSNVLWGENVVWGSNVVSSQNVLWGSNVVWGSVSMVGYNVLWGDNVVWGDAAMFPLSLSLAGDN